MSVISRRQKELLLNDVARMINNNNHTAFANHAKEAESISNGDLKFYIDSPKKEFVIRFGKKEIRFNCSEQNIKELNEIVFNNNSTLKGISDTVLLPSSSVALSTKGAQQMKQSIDTKADKEHNHDDKYADKEHNHDNKYADKIHEHPEYQPIGNYATKYELTMKSDISHIHPEYQPIGNYATKTDLTTKSDITHTHYGIDSKDNLEKFIKEVMEPPWWETLFSGLEFAGEIIQSGLIAGLLADVRLIHAALAANGIVDGIQTTSTLGTLLTGFADKIKGVSDCFKTVGDAFESLSGPINKIMEPINNMANKLNNYTKIVDEFMDVDAKEALKTVKDAYKRYQNGAQFELERLAKPTDVLKKGLLD